jgi:CRISPR-associated RAMP protein (TIGR02581 family)
MFGRKPMNAIGLEALTHRVKLRGVVETVTPLHIGLGRSQGVTGSDLPVLLDILERPVIPGSSFKGALRSQVESLVRGLGDSALLRSCDVIARQYCVEPALWRERNREAEILRRSCHVCLLFGGPHVAGKLSVPDLMVDSDWHPHMIQVRDGVSINRDTLTSESGRKFDFEVVPPGVRFYLSLVLDNPEDYEIGLLLRTLVLFDEGFAFLGGHSSRGMGRVRISIKEIIRVDARRFLMGEAIDTEVIDPDRYYEALRAQLQGQQTEGADHV